MALARERSSIPGAGPAQASSPARPAAHDDQPNWLNPALAVVALVIGYHHSCAVLLRKLADGTQLQAVRYYWRL